MDGPPATLRPHLRTPKPTSLADPIERRIAGLHAQPHITPAQQTQWDQFAQVMRENAKNMNDTLEQRRAGFVSMNAADNMQCYAQMAQQHAQVMQKIATASRALYESMSDDQKKNADVSLRIHGDHPAHKRG